MLWIHKGKNEYASFIDNANPKNYYTPSDEKVAFAVADLSSEYSLLMADAVIIDDVRFIGA